MGVEEEERGGEEMCFRTEGLNPKPPTPNLRATSPFKDSVPGPGKRKERQRKEREEREEEEEKKKRQILATDQIGWPGLTCDEK